MSSASAVRSAQAEVVANVAAILATGDPTYFQYEGACRHGLRSSLVLDGWRWQRADDKAAEIIEAAFKLIGAKRPSWFEGQPEFANASHRLYCANQKCQKPLKPNGSQWRQMYCSEPCRKRAKCDRYARDHRAEQAAASATWRAAKRNESTLRDCEWCSRPFLPLDYTGKKPQRFCSTTCRTRFAGSCNTLWRGGPRGRDGRFRQMDV